MTTRKERELERVTRLRGFRYGLHDFLAELDVNALKAVNDHVEATYLNESLLDRKTKELLIMVACVAQGDLVSHVQIHMHAAHKAGATTKEIMEVLDLWEAGSEMSARPRVLRPGAPLSARTSPLSTVWWS